MNQSIRGAGCNYTVGPLEKQILPVAYSLISLFGLPANCSILWMFHTRFLRKSGVHIYLMNLSMGDLVICLVLPFRVTLLCLGDSWTESSGRCTAVTLIINFCFYSALACRTLSIFFIGFTRYAVIVKFHVKKFGVLYKPSFAKYACVALWMFGILIVTIHSVNMLKSTRTTDSPCYRVSMEEQLLPNFIILIIGSISFLVILMALVVLYTLVVVFLFRMSKNTRVRQNRNLCRKAQVRIYVAVFACVVCQLPYFKYQLVSTIHRMTDNECRVLVKMQAVKLLLQWLVSFNSCLGPIVYMLIERCFAIGNRSVDDQTTGKVLEMETASHTQ
ncbi:probable G-protein coupled receptor 82 [Narcine bancroftii]|uniref:probable G-protein coupled receptor 82 n=1 Tax=Narcine bancroftii TaxID=1343680 RepID=UPI0038316133